MRKSIVLIVFLLASSLAVKAQKSNDPTDDVQLWPDVTLRLNLTPKTSLDFFGTVRLGRNLSHPIGEQLGVVTTYRPNQYLNLSASYRAVWSQPLPDKSSYENRIFFDVTPRLPLRNGVTITDRNRYEFREINKVLSTRYRNRLQVEKTIKWQEKSFTPYISEEVYYDSRCHEWGSRKQVYTGVRVPFTSHLSCDFMYMHNWDSHASPGYWHVFGVLTRIEF